MEEIELLEVDLKNLEDAQDSITEAMNSIVDIDKLDDEYKNLDIVFNTIDNLMSDIRAEINMLKEFEEEDREEDSKNEADFDRIDRDYDDYIFEEMND